MAEYVEALSRIRSHFPALADSEVAVANWVLNNAEQFIHLSMAQVAEKCGVSDTTVLRFCHHCGFYGFMDLKLGIARDLSSPTQLVHDAISEEDDATTLVRKVFTSNIQALHDTLAMLDMKAITKAGDMLAQARRILIIGVGTSSVMAQHMYTVLFRLGLDCRVQTDSYFQLMEVALIEPVDVVVGISQSGSAVDSVMIMEKAKANGAGTICITGNMQSPITKYADVTLLCVSHNEDRAETIASRIAQMTIADALYVILSLRDLENTAQHEKRIWDVIMPKQI